MKIMSQHNEKKLIKRKTNVPYTENYMYICDYCKIEYVPKRRRVQKFCSNSCRSKNDRLQKIISKENTQLVENTSTKIETMSVAGIGNAAAGTAVVEVVKAIFTKEENKAATKNDLKVLENNVATKEDFKKLENRIGRYHKILNIKPKLDGRKPFYDMDTNRFVYF